MSCIAYQTNKRTGTRYVYRSTSYRDPKTGKPRSKREYLGRVVPTTSEIIPKVSRGHRNTSPVFRPGDSPELDDALRELAEARGRINELEGRVAELEEHLSTLLGIIDSIGALAETARGILSSTEDSGAVEREGFGSP